MTPSSSSGSLRSVDEHLADVLSVAKALQPLEVGLFDAHGCILAEDVVAQVNLPGYDSAIVDGYAVRFADLAATPMSLPVVGHVSAGPAASLRVQPGLCVGVAAGSVLPFGADTVVPVDHTDGGSSQVRIDRLPQAGSGVRRLGEDIALGQTVLQAGSHLGSSQIALAAALGRSRLFVRPRPRVVVVSTGSDLVEPGQPLLPGQKPDSNSIALTTACLEAGAIAYHVGILPEDGPGLLDALEDQLVRADVLLLSGGSSGGAYDVVSSVLTRLGGVAFHPVAMEPAGAQGFGTIGPDATPVFVLPTDLVGALVSFEAFVRPALRRMLGATQTARPSVSALVASDLSSPAGTLSFVQSWLEVKEGRYVVRPISGSGSRLVGAMARANALAILPPDVTYVPEGTPVQVMLLERRGL
ncbi:MAG: molybdopterin molybdochelatase [Frankiales bacterium]|nr:molybdopterin molybdochelatase [Frankiales bacterium]